MTRPSSLLSPLPLAMWPLAMAMLTAGCGSRIENAVKAEPSCAEKIAKRAELVSGQRFKTWDKECKAWVRDDAAYAHFAESRP